MAVSASEYIRYDKSVAAKTTPDPPITPIMLNAGQFVCIHCTTVAGTVSFSLHGVLINNTSGVMGEPQRLAGKFLFYADGLVNLYECPAGYSMEGKLFVSNPGSSTITFRVALSAAGV